MCSAETGGTCHSSYCRLPTGDVIECLSSKQARLDIKSTDTFLIQIRKCFTANRFKANYSLPGQLEPRDGGITLLRNVGTHLPVGEA